MIKGKKKLSAISAFIMVFGIFASGCGLIEKTPEAIAKQKVARVGGEYITRGQLDDMFKPVEAQLKAQYGDKLTSNEEGRNLMASQKKSVLESMVKEKLLSQKAKELNLFNDKEIEDELNKQIQSIKESFKSEEEFNKALEDDKITIDDLKKFYRVQVMELKAYETTTKDVTVADADVQKYYDENKAIMTEQPNTMEVSHILVKTEQEAKDIKDRLDKGEDFAALAKQYSTDEASKNKGGSLDTIMYNDPNYDTAFMKAAMALKEGETSGPVQSGLGYGYHIIRVTKKTEYPIKPFDSVKDTIKEMLLDQKKAEKYDGIYKGWEEKAKIKYYEDNINNVK